jgi:hypothetical protein
MRRIGLLIALAGLAVGVPPALAEEAPREPASETAAPAPIQQGATLAAPPPTTPAAPETTGGTSAGKAKATPPPTEPTPSSEPDGGAPAPPVSDEAFAIPSIPSSSCASSGVPPILIPIFQRAAAAYELGPQGPAVLAGINDI